MICESCGATIPDDASVCPECGVSTSLFLEKPVLQTVTQTVPGFVKRSGVVSADPGQTEELLSVNQEQPANRSNSSTYQPAKKQSSARSGSDKNGFATLSLVISTATLLIGGIILLLWILLNIWLDIFSLYAYFMFALPAAFLLSIIGIIYSIKNPKTAFNAYLSLIFCLLAAALFFYVFKFCLVPHVMKSVSGFLIPGMQRFIFN